MEERKGAHRTIMDKSKGRRQLGRHRRRWEDNIKINV